MIRIRPHHLLCIRGFKGKGYSEDFVDNMRQVITELYTNPTCSVEITDGTDDICRACPKCSADGRCEDEEIVRRYDRNTVSVFNLRETNAGFCDIMEQIGRRLDQEHFDRVCADCRWREDCI